MRNEIGIYIFTGKVIACSKLCSSKLRCFWVDGSYQIRQRCISLISAAAYNDDYVS